MARNEVAAGGRLTPGSSAEAVSARRWWILAVLSLCLLVAVIDNTILNVALPSVQRDLGATQSQQQWFLDAYTLVFACLLFTWGITGDRIGRRRMLIAGLVLFGVSSGVSAFSTSAGMLIAARSVMAVGGAAILPNTLSIIQNVFAGPERGRAIGIWAGVAGLAVGLGPLGGGLLLEHFWWGSVFLVNVPLVIIAVVAIRWIVPESQDPHPQSPDVIGVLLSIVGLALVVYGIIQGGNSSFTAPSVLASILGGLVVLAIMVMFERRSSHPALDVALFTRPAVTASSAAILLAFFGLFGATFFLTYYLQFVRAYSPLEAGLRIMPVAIALLVFSSRSTVLVARFGARIVVGTGLLLAAGAFLVYQLIDVHTNIWVLETLLFVQGMGLANVNAPATATILAAVPPERAGAGAAINNVARQLGGALGVAVLGSVLATTYANRIRPALSAVPANVRGEVSRNVGATLEAVAPLGPRGTAIAATARTSFIHAMHVTALGSAAIVLLGAVVTFVWMPGRQRS